VTLGKITIAARILTGVVWSLGLVTAGASLMSYRPGPDLPILPPVALILAGLSAVVAGQFIFMVIVADRVFPGANAKLVAACEWVVAAGLALLMATTACFAAYYLLK